MKFSINFENIKTYTVVIGSLIIVLALIPLVIIPQLSLISADSEIINRNRDRLNVIEQKAAVLEQHSRYRSLLDSQLEVAERVLPLSQSISSLVLGVQHIAMNNNLTVNMVRLQPGKVATDSARPVDQDQSETGTATDNINLRQDNYAVVFEMNLEGDLGSLHNFLRVLERGRRLLIFKQFQAETNVGNAYRVQIFLAAPYSPLPKITQDQVAVELPEISDQDRKLLDKIGSNLLRDVTATKIVPGPSGVTDPFQVEP